MAPGELSSNWKELQKKIQSQQPPATNGHVNPLKRKYSSNRPEPRESRPEKRAKIISKKPRGSNQKSRTMGLSWSSEKAAAAPEKASTPATRLSSATNSHTSLSDPTTGVLSQTDPPNLGHYPTSQQKARYLALDCEMVGVGPPPHVDSQLARVSLTNYHGALVYDSFVLPPLPVTDHRTAFSGVRPADLLPGVARPAATVRRDVAALLEGRVLVGHALRNDLGVLALRHPPRDVRDTARHPAYRAITGGRTPALRRLAAEVLGVEVQAGEHSSVEDARVSMLLYRHDKDEFEKEAARRYGPRGAEGAIGKSKGKGEDVQKEVKVDGGRWNRSRRDASEGEESDGLEDGRGEGHSVGGGSEAKKKKKKGGKKRTKRR